MAGYGDDTAFAAYLTANGYTLPDGAASAAILRQRGSAYIDALYGWRFPGVPVDGSSQDRAWPRTGAHDIYGTAIASDAVPTRIIDASYEAAWIEANSAGALSKTFTPGEQKVLTEVKGIKWTLTGDATREKAMSVVSTVIEGILYPLIGSDMRLPAVAVV